MSNWKHNLKGKLADRWARLLYATPLWRVTNALAPRRMLVLFGHCVDDTNYNGLLAPDMCMSQAKLKNVLESFSERGYEFTTIAKGMDALKRGTPGKSLVNLSMDDGYLDNHDTLLPILESQGLTASVFLETRVLDERRVNWTHHLHWLFDRLGKAEVVKRYIELEGADSADSVAVQQAFDIGSRAYYHVKRILKYDVDPHRRNDHLASLFAQSGGDEKVLADRLYLTWEKAEALGKAGIELGAHTMTHAILSKLTREQSLAEVDGSARAMEARLGHSPEVFAYPFGRRWDYNDDSMRAVSAAGCRYALNTHKGCNTGDSPALELRRVPIEQSTPLYMLHAEACGGFLLLEKLGIKLSE
jgi:peptidoglycan/xylan/chitin deacetylase (PgdA/CDA1 family)